MYFPTYSLKNFYKDPYKVIDFAKTCEFKKDETNRWPGKRSSCLSIINPSLFHYSCKKILNMVYGNREPLDFEAWNGFQLISNQDVNGSNGHLHKDPNILTAIIYLSSSTNSGTKILDNVPEESENYIDFVYHSSLFNSLILFEGANPHQAVFDFNNSQERLTQIIFFHKLKTSWYPIPEMDRVC